VFWNEKYFEKQPLPHSQTPRNTQQLHFLYLMVRYKRPHPLQDFTVLQTDQIRQYEIHIPSLSLSVKKYYRWFYKWKMRAKKKFPLEIYQRTYFNGDSSISSKYVSTLN
jgi:hypothetical protein